MHPKTLSSALIHVWIAALWMWAPPLPAQDTVRRLTQEEVIKAAVTKPQGRVELEISIDPAGAVDNAKVLTGTTANTLKRWRFEPFVSGGKPVRAVASMGFSCKL